MHTPRYEKILAEQDKKFEDQIIAKDDSFRNNDSSSLLTNIKTLDNAIKEAEQKKEKLAPQIEQLFTEEESLPLP